MFHVMTRHVPVRLGETHREMLEELMRFWGDNQSDVVRRALETEQQMMTIALGGTMSEMKNFAIAHFDSVRERYHEEIARLRREAAELEEKAAG